MFNNLKITNFKGLKECKLLSLGKVNVLCGKNNSGKSTILEAIHATEHRSPGIVFSQSDVEVVFDDSRKAIDWVIIRPVVTEAWKALLNKVFLQKDGFWFEDEYNDFIVQIKKGFETNPLDSQLFPDGYLHDVYKHFFPTFPEASTILLPPKRNLEITKVVASDQKLSAQGAGILDYLFKAQSHEPGSQLYNIYDQIAKAFDYVSDGYKFHIRMEEKNEISLMFSKDNSPWIDASSCGLGLQDLLVILFFGISPEANIVLIEEPESHIHPDMQRRLLYYLRNETNKQYFFSTHSNIFLDGSLVDRAYLVFFEDQVMTSDVTNKAAALNELGFSVTDNLVSDLVIFTEGPTDIPVIEEFLMKMGLLKDYNIKTWFLGGDTMDQIDLSVLTQNLKAVALIDKDPGSAQIRERFKENCKNYKIDVTQLERYSIENYFTLEALRKVFGSQIPKDMTDIDPNTKLEDQIHINTKKNNRKIAQNMTLEDIAETDLCGFLNKVESICRGN